MCHPMKTDEAVGKPCNLCGRTIKAGEPYVVLLTTNGGWLHEECNRDILKSVAINDDDSHPRNWNALEWMTAAVIVGMIVYFIVLVVNGWAPDEFNR